MSHTVYCKDTTAVCLKPDKEKVEKCSYTAEGSTCATLTSDEATVSTWVLENKVDVKENSKTSHDPLEE